MSETTNRSQGVRMLPGMDDVDDSGHAENHVRYLDTLTGLTKETEQFDWKRISYTALDLQPGGHVLDVGCGTGDDVRALAEIVGAAGRAVGLDSSQTMIGEARQRSEGSTLPVDFRVGDAYDLPFESGEFDACREERMLQHLDEPERAIAEMVRVTRSGGRVAAMEPDWDTKVIDVPDRGLFRRIQQFSIEDYRGGTGAWMGRQLYRRMGEAGLIDLTVMPYMLAMTDLAVANALVGALDAADAAREAGVITEDELRQWRGWLQEADAAGRFFSAMGGIIVAGTKP